MADARCEFSAATSEDQALSKSNNTNTQLNSPVYTGLVFDKWANSIHESMFTIGERILDVSSLLGNIPGKAKDYLAIYPSGIEIAETQGCRRNQEDRVDIDEHVLGFEQLCLEERVIALRSTLKSINEDLNSTQGVYERFKLADTAGSCALAVTVTGAQVEVANLGDSTAYAVLVKRDGTVKMHRINELHQPYHPAENDRLYQAFMTKTPCKTFFMSDWLEDGSYSHTKRTLPSGLAVSRALGDFDTEGLSDEAEVTSYEFSPSDLSAGAKAFILLACDGLTENILYNDLWKSTSAEMAKFHSELKLKECEFLAKHMSDYLQADARFVSDFIIPQNITAYLVQKALTFGSRDNITAVMLPIDLDSPTTKMAAVFDGHGGDFVSDYCSKVFKDRLRQQVVKILNSRNNISAAVAKPADLANSVISMNELAVGSPYDAARPSMYGVFASPQPTKPILDADVKLNNTSGVKILRNSR